MYWLAYLGYVLLFGVGSFCLKYAERNNAHHTEDKFKRGAIGAVICLVLGVVLFFYHFTLVGVL